MTDLEIYLRARYPLLYLLTPEEERAMATLRALADTLGKELVSWSFTEGLGGDLTARDPLAALEAIFRAETKAIYVLRDLHAYFGNPAVLRKLRELGHHVKQSAKSVILLAPVLALPPELAKEVTVVDFPLPSATTIGQMIPRTGTVSGRPISLDLLQHERLVDAARGLTAGEIANALAKALVVHRGLDERAISVMIEEKRQAIRKTGVLEYHEAPEGLEGIGGLDGLKGWLGKRARAFGARAREFGLPEPRGLLLVGVQGCGKSLMAKSVAAQWKLPLLRLDLGRVMAGLVGSSEENLRQALALAEALSPVVLWVDEIEKGLVGLGSQGDGGTASRVIATFLTWLQEKTSPVFVVATANHIDLLPPEMLRKGRFDEVFFVDLPDREERRGILEIHLKKRKRAPSEFDLAALARITEGFSGAEIEQALVAALYDAFEQDRPLTEADLRTAIAQTVPLSRTASASIEGLRAWARDKARPASMRPELPASASRVLAVDLPG